MNILWLKRDLRIKDHLPLMKASNKEFIVVYIFEPSVSYNYDFDIRHWQFVYESLIVLEKEGLKVHKLYAEAIEVFDYLGELYNRLHIYSHAETGNDLTYQRDLNISDYLKTNGYLWSETRPYGVVRGLQSRAGWDQNWIQYVKAKTIDTPNLSQMLFNNDIEKKFQLPSDLEKNLKSKSKLMLKGGSVNAHCALSDFLNKKVNNYWASLSFPEKSNYFSSKLSAHISWGNISIRQIYQACESKKIEIQNKQSLDQFMARLKWHCHFIQKLESEPRIEFENLNLAFNGIRAKKSKTKIKAWKEGMTGYPLVDAAMRCVVETGYLNFRLRAMVVSFLTHSLWQPWQAGAGFLARQFLDYEPGIHFSQFQMQAGTTGINTLRIYNPVKQSKEKDSEAHFIKRWVPELSKLPVKFIHEPWLLTDMDELLYDFSYGVDYPLRIVDIDKAHKKAKEILWSTKESKSSKNASKSILNKHARKRNYGNHR